MIGLFLYNIRIVNKFNAMTKQVVCDELTANRGWCKPEQQEQMKIPSELLAEITVGDAE